jgi:hypothetical protein
MRTRLRPAYSEEELKKVYATPHAHSTWPDHRARVRATIALAQWFEDVRSVADLSAGDATIIDALDIHAKYIGDFAPRYEFTGPIEKTIDLIPKVDLFILSETIEHVDDPDLLLRKIREKTRFLVLSTPNGEDNAGNPEHYWGWNADDMKAMMVEAGFEPVIYSSLSFADPGLVYNYQIWGCK